MLPSTLPLFPLPNAVLFPQVFLPLHIFENRYRRMVADALAGDRLIGMVLLRPGWEADYEGRPPVYSVGCAGLVTFSEQHPDGRYNIVLRGLERFRIVSEDHSRPYRVALVEGLGDDVRESDGAAIRAARHRLEALLVQQPEGGPSEGSVPPAIGDEDLVNALAQYLNLDPLEKQALLELDSLSARCQSLIDLLEMRVLASRRTWGGTH